MKHTFEQKIYFADTDAYGVVWHGTYLRWLEIGRCEFCEMLGHDLLDLQANDVSLPVTNVNVRYKASAKLDNIIIIDTWISKVTPLSITFSQTIKDKETGKLFIQATVDVVAVNSEGKLYRRMPEVLLNSFKEVIEE